MWYFHANFADGYGEMRKIGWLSMKNESGHYGFC